MEGFDATFSKKNVPWGQRVDIRKGC